LAFEPERAWVDEAWFCPDFVGSGRRACALFFGFPPTDRAACFPETGLLWRRLSSLSAGERPVRGSLSSAIARALFPKFPGFG
jgi:hypothetical protein